MERPASRRSWTGPGERARSGLSFHGRLERPAARGRSPVAASAQVIRPWSAPRPRYAVEPSQSGSWLRPSAGARLVPTRPQGSAACAAPPPSPRSASPPSPPGPPQREPRPARRGSPRTRIAAPDAIPRGHRRGTDAPRRQAPPIEQPARVQGPAAKIRRVVAGLFVAAGGWPGRTRCGIGPPRVRRLTPTAAPRVRGSSSPQPSRRRRPRGRWSSRQNAGRPASG